jgi:hypothetical protein
MPDFERLSNCVNALPPVYFSGGPYDEPDISRKMHQGGGRYWTAPDGMQFVFRSPVDWHVSPIGYPGVQVDLDGTVFVYDGYDKVIAAPKKGAGGPRVCKGCGALWQPVRQKELACSPECLGKAA